MSIYEEGIDPELADDRDANDGADIEIVLPKYNKKQFLLPDDFEYEDEDEDDEVDA